jgi:hypothetical protein
MSVNLLTQRLDACPTGNEGWSEFEDVCTEIFTYLFVPPLQVPHRQAKTLSGINRRDAIYQNRNNTPNGEANTKNWHYLFNELAAKLILIEYKNYDVTEIGPEEVNCALNYLTNPMGRLAILVCSKEPNAQAKIRRNAVYTNDKKVVLFVTKQHLKEMLAMKGRGEDPSDLIVDLIELFYIQHE